MNRSPQPQEHRLAELLCDRALTGLDPRETEELDRLLEHEGLEEDLGLELVAAQLELGFLDNDLEPMPAGLAAKIIAEAPPHIGVRMEVRPAARVIALPLHDDDSLRNMDALREWERDVLRDDDAGAPPAARARGAWAWPVAAAACIAFLVGALAGSRTQPPVALALQAQMGPFPVTVERPAPDLSEQRQALLTEAKDIVKIEWKATEDAASQGSSGDVVWSPSQQRGFMRFRGLKQNDATRLRYQLWIFDKKRDDRYPVDGGLFDIDRKTGDVIVPITAQIPVLDPALFAVTAEQPNGVVVSDRKRIVLTAAPPSEG
ncbi:MAG: anti-sigma factor [Myxococcota bacterium]